MNSSKNVKKAINQSISDINKSIVEEKPCCPYCGSEDIDRISDLTSKDKLIAYYCNNCNEYFISPATTGNQEKEHQIKTFNNKEERAKESGDETQRHLANLFAQIMNEHDFSHPDEGINFLLQHYEKTRDMMQPKKRRTSPGKMKIDDVEKYIKVRANPNGPYGHFTTNAEITITYVKAFTDTVESIDTATFNCPSINNLKYQWIEFLRKTGLQEDCIAFFSVDISIRDKAYIEDINSALDSLIASIYVDDENITNKKITEEDRQEILKNILGSSYFEGSDKIIYPHIVAAKDPNTGIMAKSVERYWGE